MSGWEKLRLLAIMVLIAMIAIVATTLTIRADELTLRKQFFDASKAAVLLSGEVKNCCGEGDALRVKIIGGGAGTLAAEVIDTMRHPTAKIGEVYTVPRRLIAKHPYAPSFLGTILFVSTSSSFAERRVYCLMPEVGG